MKDPKLTLRTMLKLHVAPLDNEEVSFERGNRSNFGGLQVEVKVIIGAP